MQLLTGQWSLSTTKAGYQYQKLSGAEKALVIVASQLFDLASLARPTD
jgi:hypothetical protein